jgi:hypothetical protein
VKSFVTQLAAPAQPSSPSSSPLASIFSHLLKHELPASRHRAISSSTPSSLSSSGNTPKPTSQESGPARLPSARYLLRHSAPQLASSSTAHPCTPRACACDPGLLRALAHSCRAGAHTRPPDEQQRLGGPAATVTPSSRYHVDLGKFAKKKC